MLFFPCAHSLFPSSSPSSKSRCQLPKIAERPFSTHLAHSTEDWQCMWDVSGIHSSTRQNSHESAHSDQEIITATRSSSAREQSTATDILLEADSISYKGQHAVLRPTCKNLLCWSVLALSQVFKVERLDMTWCFFPFALNNQTWRRQCLRRSQSPSGTALLSKASRNSANAEIFHGS